MGEDSEKKMKKEKKVIFLALFCISFSVPLNADIKNFDIAGRIYTKWLYRNDDTQGVLTYGNPFWPDDIAGGNGVGSEFELTIFGRVSEKVEAKVRLASRFGGLWQDWWESGNRNYNGVMNTSGDSMGMNKAEYLKLRGYTVRMAIPFPTVDWVTVGSSDLGMFNPWTIGKIRYIDRDNGKGTFVDGHFSSQLAYTLAVVALPKLWVGPWWSTGIGDPAIRNPFYSQDWAYGAKFRFMPGDKFSLTMISTLTDDLEIDITDPDAVGSLYPDCKDELGNAIEGCSKDNAVDWHSRYMNSVSTIECDYTPTDKILTNFTGGYSMQFLDKQLTANGVALNDGMFPIVYDDTKDFAFRARMEIVDPIGIGLSFRGEYFYIGSEWNSIFGARREADVLLTDGFIEGGQLPTLNLANEFLDFDEDFVESCIGWHGATGILNFSSGDLDLNGEFTYLTYATNMQDRDVDNKYPDFLWTDAYTDVELFDYANITDRGRDPRSVFKKNQDRRSFISVLKAKYILDVGSGIEFTLKGKYIKDLDFRSLTTKDDDYNGDIWTGLFKAGYNLTDGLKLEAGGKMDYWNEINRKGSIEQGYNDGTTTKYKGFINVSYYFEGVKFKYGIEYLHKYQEREAESSQKWDVFRSKASLEVAW
jgi:hypothetical protein